MGVVYQAWDEELGVAVALKVIRPEVLQDLTTAGDVERRFKRELVLARQVTHRNVVRIHDLGELGGIKYLTMPFVEGENLADLLKREGKLPVPRALATAKQVASGLAAAHEVGVVHRDLKPENIMIAADGSALIMDFGISRSLSGTGTATAMGSVIGTLEYMAPEQAQGVPVDQRADIYSFGLMLYDMLAGRQRIARRDNPMSEMMSRMTAPLPSVRTLEPAIPEPVDHVIARCVQPSADARFANATELLHALEALDPNGHVLVVSRPPAGLSRRMIAVIAAALIAVLAAGGYWLYSLRPQPAAVAPAAVDPVSVLIADFRNGTGDPAFDQTLEPMLKIALEDAGFITAFDRLTIRRTLGVRPPDALDERAAQAIAVNQGLGVVVAGALESEGSGYAVSLEALYAVTGNVIAQLRRTAPGRAQVLAAATGLASELRNALGDQTPEADRRFAMETLSATSIEVVREYAAAANAMSNSKFDAALRHFAKAVEIDAAFGLGYAGLAIASRNLDRQQDSEKYIAEAVRHVDGMTERERYRTRGLYYMITGDPKQCVKEFGDLIDRFAADASARNNLALCATYLRDMPRAVAEMRKVVAILPKRALYRENLVLYEAYSGDAEAAATEARAIADRGLYAELAIAFAQLLKGDLSAAAATYGGLARFDELGVSYKESGLGDLALYEGRFADAAAIFARGAAADLASKETDRAANKYAALAYAELLRGDAQAAIKAADRALELSPTVKIRFLTGRVFTEAGAQAKAHAQQQVLAKGVNVQHQTYARHLEGLAALGAGDAPRAIALLNDATALLDTWIGHFDLGRAYLAAEAFTQADSEFDRCIKRRGEALSLFLDEEPTFGFFPPVYYYQGRVREGLKSPRFGESYQRYLDLRGKSPEDPLAADVRRRRGAQ
jgi:tetratricopeptide (TPR) repeat protein